MFRKYFNFSANVWVWDIQKSAWHFVTLPGNISSEIKTGYPFPSRGFGSIPVQVTLGSSTWKTSIFPDSKTGNYLLPLKAAIRKVQQIEVGQVVNCKIEIEF